MPDSVTVNSDLEPLGDRLLHLLDSGATIHNPLKLLCQDGRTVKTVHRDVLQASSTYFRQLLSRKPDPDRPISVPISGRILALIIEHIYTTRITSVQTEDLTELSAAAQLFQLDELACQLNGSRRNRRAEPQPADARKNLMTECSLETRLIGEAALAALSRRFASNEDMSSEPRSYSIPLVSTADGTFTVVDGRLVELDNSQAVATQLYHAGDACITGNKAFVLVVRNCASDDLYIDIRVYNLPTGELLRTFQHSVKSIPPTVHLVPKLGRVYTFIDGDVYDVDPSRSSLLCRTKRNISGLAIAEHSRHTCKFYFVSDDQLYAATYDSHGEAFSESRVLSDISIVIGVHEDRVFAYSKNNEFVIVHDGSIIWKYPFRMLLSGFANCDHKIYLKFDRWVTVVDSVTRVIDTIPLEQHANLIIKEVIA